MGPAARSLETCGGTPASGAVASPHGRPSPPPRAHDNGSSDVSEDNRSRRLARPALPGRRRALVNGPLRDVGGTAQETFVRPAHGEMQHASWCAHSTVRRADARDVVTEMMSAEEHARTSQTAAGPAVHNVARSPLAFRASRGVLRRRRCGPPPGKCGGSSVAARPKMRDSMGMPSVLHSNPTGREILDIYITVLTAEPDLALTADRKAPSLGLESPNEDIRGLKTVSSASTGDGTHCRAKTDISIATQVVRPRNIGLTTCHHQVFCSHQTRSRPPAGPRAPTRQEQRSSSKPL
jgi:hypothetical protein